MKLKLFFIQILTLLSFQAIANENVMSFNKSTDWDTYIAAAKNKASKNTTASAVNNKSALWYHVQFFANQNGQLEEKTMKKPHDLLGIYKNVKYKIQAIFNMLDRKNLAYLTDNLVTIYNPASTGLWDKNGEFNETKFQQLSQLAIEDNGNKIITKKIFMKFLNSIEKNGSEKKVAATVTIIWPIKVNITWQQVTQASIDELFGYLATYKYKHGNKVEKAFTVESLRMFYTRAEKYMQNIIESKHALIKDKFSGCPFNQIHTTSV
jgi:hypothetical protein